MDAREIAGKPTGVGTYLSQLLRQWQRMPEAAAHRWTLYVPEGRGPGMESGASQSGTSVSTGLRVIPEAADTFASKALPGTGGTWWEQRTLAAAVRAARPDVLFAPGYTAPLAVSLPVVLTIHDLSFVAHPEWFSLREGWRRRVLTRLSARRARTILTVSEFSRAEIVARFGIPPARVRAIPHGVERPSCPPPADPRPPIVLFVGSIFNRRRVPDLVRAFALVTKTIPDARLEIVGDNRTHPRLDLAALARSLGVADRVALRSYVADEELRLLYSQAGAFAFLSEYEGFGFTPLEAIAHAAPVVVLDTPVAREIYAEAALYVRSGDVPGTATALEQLLLDTALRRRQLDAGTRVLDRYHWPEAARRALGAIEEAGARG